MHRSALLENLYVQYLWLFIGKYGQNFLGQLGLDYLWPLSFMLFISYLV